MKIVGGIYEERCRHPSWRGLFGSGMRAAIAVSKISPGSELYAYAPKPWSADIRATLDAFRIASRLEPVETGITFEYLHPFGLISMSNPPIGAPLLEVEGDVVLRFGMLEGDARVSGKRVIYDPQAEKPANFSNNKSTADELALIVTRRDLFFMSTRKDPGGHGVEGAGGAIADQYDARGGKPLVILVKDRLGGTYVLEGDDSPVYVPAVRAGAYFRIGSGDVFASAFAYAWGEQRMQPVKAVEYAARCLAYFVEGPRLPLLHQDDLPDQTPAPLEQRAVRLLGQGTVGLELLLWETGMLVEDLGRKSISSLRADQSDEFGVEANSLIFIEAEWDAELLAQFDDRSRGSFRVIYCADPNLIKRSRMFTDAMFVTDYASAVYHALLGEKK